MGRGRCLFTLFAIAIAAVPTMVGAKPGQRLPAGYSWGRCLLKVEGKTYISGPCAYTFLGGGSFQIDGPNQIYGGIDYPEGESGALAQSRDYFAQVDVEGRTGEGFWNADKRATHAQAHLGSLKRQGACWVNKQVKVCLWR